MNLKTTTPVLEFDAHAADLAGGLSAALLLGDDLWLACDELTSVERLTLRGDGLAFAGHRTFELRGPLALPADGESRHDGKKIDPEIDIEGLDFEGGYLWLAGSHSPKRKKLDKDDRERPAAEQIEKLARVDPYGNRFLLARVPFVRDAGESVLAPASADRTLTAARLPGTMTDNFITDAIAGKGGGTPPDPHLAPWLALPGKDNGFDIEGLAVAGGRVFLGLRGPVLRGWAVVLELRVEDAGPGALALEKIGPQGRAYRKHFLNLGGLGVRDLVLDGADLLILAGPTMTHDGPVRVFRWRDAARADGESVVWPNQLGEPLLEVRHGAGVDRAEGMSLVPGADPAALLVVYDAPSRERVVEKDKSVLADVFELPR